MKHPFLRWLALLFSLLTATSHASHFKGGTLSWERLATEPGFTVKASVTISYDLSTDLISPADANTPKVNGLWVYTEDMAVNGGCQLKWGDGNTVNLTEFEVVSVDYAAQIVTVQATNEAAITHAYQANGAYTMAALGADRDSGEELANREGTVMRIESALAVNVTTPSNNRPPAFNPAGSNLIIVEKGNITFQAPVATDADGDTVKYRFVTTEGNATEGYSGPSWESDNGLTITTAGVISWNTSAIEQTVHTRAIQVVAEDFATPSSTVAKSSSAVEFQVWVNNPDQDGVPEIELAPTFTTYTAYPGQLFQFRILGTDHHDPDEFENSRLEAVIPAQDMPPGSVLVPSGGFAGEGSGLDTEHDHGSRMEAVFSWIPATGQANTSWTLHITVEDEDSHVSSQKTVVINVVPAGSIQALQLSVTPGTEEPDPITGVPTTRVVGRIGEDLTFSVTGSCATSGTQLQLFTLNELPHGAAMSPALPATNTNSVQSTFTWEDLTEDDVTDQYNPHEVTFITGDAHGREIARKVRIYILPQVPTITLAPAEPTSISATPWQTVTFDFKVSGGSASSPWLSLEALDVGGFEHDSVVAPATATFVWRVLPGQLRSGVVRIKVTDNVGQSAILSIPATVANPAAPQWWEDSDVVTGGASQDYGIANQGQLKAITAAAYEAIEAEHPDLATATPAGTALFEFVDGFSTTSGNYSPASQGQAKNAANLVYRAIEAVIGKGNIGVPWTSTWEDDQHNAPASVGQIKTLFSFPAPVGGLFNDPPSVTLTSPTQGGTFDDLDTITITATAGDTDGSIASVAFYANGTLLNTDTVTPYSFAWNGMDPGNYVIKAVATDNRGATRESAVNITVTDWINTPPTVTITSPVSGQNLPTPAYVTITANASDPDTSVEKVSFYYGEEFIGEDTSSPYSVVWNRMLVGSGSYTIEARARDTHGEFGYHTVSFNVTPPPSGSTATIELVHGVKGYAGTTDTYVMANLPDSPRGTSSYVTMDNNPDNGGLVRWDTSLIPANAIVTDADLTFWVGYQGNSLRQFEIYPMLRDWDETSATWNKATATQDWGTAGIQSTATDRSSTVIGTITGPTHETAVAVNLNTAGIQKVQEWVNNPSSNKGITIQHYANGGTATKELSLYTRGAFNDYKRPKLAIKYKFP